jgi:hypothetical protein
MITLTTEECRAGAQALLETAELIDASLLQVIGEEEDGRLMYGRTDFAAANCPGDDLKVLLKRIERTTLHVVLRERARAMRARAIRTGESV